MPKAPRKRLAKSERTSLLPGAAPAYLDAIISVIDADYQFVRELGRGKNGAAYLIQSRTNETIQYCLKTISPDVTTEPDRRRVAENLKTEVEILAPLTHKCLPTVVRHDVECSLPFYICTFHPGETFRAFRKSAKRLSIQESIFVISSILDVLEYLHNRGRTHCDLHSENIMVSDEVFRTGLLLIDFGSGHRGSDSSPYTEDRGVQFFKETADRHLHATMVRRDQSEARFEGYDFAGVGTLLAEMSDCFFSDATPSQIAEYRHYCSNLKNRRISDWIGAKEQLRFVIDPERLLTATRPLFLSPSGDRRSIPLPGRGSVPVGDGILAVINTPAFQRLRGIRQLSFCDWFFPGGTHTRFEHSIGVFGATVRAVRVLARQREFRDITNEPQVRGLLLASLLHDVGHYPFAHPLEQFVASRFLGAPGAKDAVSHSKESARLIESDPDIRKAVDRFWGETTADHALKILDRKVPVLSDVIDGPVDCDKLDYLGRDALHCGVAFGKGLDVDAIISSYCCVKSCSELGIRRDGLSAVEGMLVLQDQMLSSVYWHPCTRAAMAMFHSAIAYIVRKDAAIVGELARALKVESSEHAALTGVIVPRLQAVKGFKKEGLERLIRFLSRPQFGDIFVLLEEYRRTDPPPADTPARHNIYESIVASVSSAATTVPVKWESARDLWQAYLDAIRAKNVKINACQIVVDVPYGKSSHRVPYVRDEDEHVMPITDLSHLKPSILEEPTLYLSPVRIYVDPEIYRSINDRVEAIRHDAEDRYLSRKLGTDVAG